MKYPNDMNRVFELMQEAQQDLPKFVRACNLATDILGCKYWTIGFGDLGENDTYSDACTLVGNFHPSFGKDYHQYRFADVDKGIFAVVNGISSFHWSENDAPVWASTDRNTLPYHCVEAAGDAGLLKGFTVALSTSQINRFFGVSFVYDKDSFIFDSSLIEFFEERRTQITAFARHAYIYSPYGAFNKEVLALNDLEIDILLRRAAGMSVKQMAIEDGIPFKKIENQLGRATKKLFRNDGRLNPQRRNSSNKLKAEIFRKRLDTLGATLAPKPEKILMNSG